MSITYKSLFENLSKIGGKKGKDCVHFLSPDLLIKEKETGVKYTIISIGKDKKTNQPVIRAYRYYGPDTNRKKFFINIHTKKFKQYTPV